MDVIKGILKSNAIIALLIGMILAAMLIQNIWTSSLNLVFTPVFWVSSVNLFVCIVVLAHMFITHGGSTRNYRFNMSILLIICVAEMYSGFENVAEHNKIFKDAIRGAYPYLFFWLSEFINFTKNIISFGIAAIAASVAANAIVEK